MLVTLLKKETLAHVFSCEFCEIFKNSSFYRIPMVAASEKALCNLPQRRHRQLFFKELSP